MAICVSCGLFVNEDGMLEVKRDPAGGISCGPAGLSVAGASNAALTCCNEAKGQAAAAQNTANIANSKADTALDRVPNKIRWGHSCGTTNGAGTFTFPHTLGVTPASVVLTPHNTGADQNWHLSVENFDNVLVNVKVYKTDTLGFYIGSSFCFYWFAAA